MTFPTLPHAQAVKVEVIITQLDGSIIRWVCDDFDYLDIDKFDEPQYFNDYLFMPFPPVPRTKSLVFSIERPKNWTVYMPTVQEQPAIDDGDTLEEPGE